MTTANLIAYQACFVVSDVGAAVEFCTSQLGWGPFQHFKIPSPDAKYRDWKGHKVTEVALGMAGKSQVELIHVHQGKDAIEGYQTTLGPGLQHLGVLCKSTNESVQHLTAAGAVMNDSNQYGKIIFTFVDVPTGPAMIELLERGEQGLPTNDSATDNIGDTEASTEERLNLDRATIVSSNIERDAAFFAHSFKQTEVSIFDDTLRQSLADSPPREVAAKRCLIDGGVLQLELIQVDPSGDDVYARQLVRSQAYGQHGLLHVGGSSDACSLPGQTIDCEWLEHSEKFRLFSGPDNRMSLQVRAP